MQSAQTKGFVTKGSECACELPLRLLVCLGLSTLAPLTASGPASASTATAFLGTAFFALSLLLGLRACLGRLAGSAVDAGAAAAADVVAGGDVWFSPKIADGDGKGSGLPSAISRPADPQRVTRTRRPVGRQLLLLSGKLVNQGISSRRRSFRKDNECMTGGFLVPHSLAAGRAPPKSDRWRWLRCNHAHTLLSRNTMCRGRRSGRPGAYQS